MISWSTGTSLGRVAALSMKELQVHHDKKMERKRSRKGSKGGNPQSADVDLERDGAARAARAAARAEAAAAKAAARQDEFVGTALVLGFLQAEMLMPLPQLKKLQAAAKKHFAGVLTPAGRDYTFLQNAWIVAFDGNLNSGGSWLICARLLKLVLSQSVDGSWDASSTVAFALLARQQQEIDDLPDSILDKLKAIFNNADALGITGEMEDEAAEVEDDEEGGDGDGDDGGGGKEGGGDDSKAVGGDGGAYEGEEVEVEAGAQAELEHHCNAVSKTQAVVLKRANQESLLAMRTYSGRLDLTWDEAKAEAGDEITDCPVTFSVFALKETLPLDLAALGPEARALEVWATMCCITVLERFKACWLVGDGELCPARETTIVDAAQQWLEGQCAAQPTLARAMEGKRGKEMHTKAALLTITWQRAWLHRVKLLRQEEALISRQSKDQLERAGKALAQAAISRHETFSTFLAPAGRYRRWQKFFVLITMVLCCLCMNIWMVRAALRSPRSAARSLAPATQYELKATNCCAAIRLILDSGPDGGNCPPGAGPCRGFDGNCADIADQFSDLPVLPDWPTGLADYECHAFPDDARFTDTLLVSLLAIAVALPCSFFIFICFDLVRAGTGAVRGLRLDPRGSASQFSSF